MSVGISIEARNGEARAGTLHTPHGDVQTPTFMPVGTKGTVKGLSAEDLSEIGAGVVLGNTYHLYFRPGQEIVRGAGGLHGFSRWSGPMLTDSGGYQVFSLAKTRNITERGVEFASVYDGSMHEFTPEMATLVQEDLGADIAMVFDECPPSGATREYHDESLMRTARWAERCREAHTREDQAQFGIVQGGLFPDLREKSLELTVALDFPGYAVGGLSVGESRDEMLQTLSITTPNLPTDKPRYFMGIGDPVGILQVIGLGVDMFDCVLPTRLARHGTALTSSGRINLKNSRFRTDFGRLDGECGCRTCEGYSPAYLSHLVREDELLGHRAVTYHNVYFVTELCRQAREHIIAGDFEEWSGEWMRRYTGNVG